MSQRADIEFGTKSELDNMEVLQRYLDTTLERKGGYSVFDFENPDKTIMVELKSRRIAHNTYESAMINLSKIAFCELMTGVTFYIVFCYTDGLYSIKYNKELFDSFEVRKGFKRGFREDATNNPSDVVMIPVKLLTKIELPPSPQVTPSQPTTEPPPLVDDGDEKEEEPHFYA